MNTITYISITEAITELSKVGENEIVTKLKSILENNEIEKPGLHNRKDDKTTSHYRVDLPKEDLIVIVDVFVDLEIESLTEDGEATRKTERYVTLADNWSCIS